MKYQVVFYDDFCESPLNQLFDTKEEAEQFAYDQEYDFQDIVIIDGEDQWKTFYRFYNPENNQNDFLGFDVIEIKN